MGSSSWDRVRVGEVTCMRGQRRAPETWARTASRSGRRGSHFTRLGRYYFKSRIEGVSEWLKLRLNLIQ